MARGKLSDYLQARRTEAVRLYAQGGTPAKIAISLGTSAGAVRSWLRKEGVKLSKSAGLKAAYAEGRRSGQEQSDNLRRYSIDEQVFERPLTPETAWVLGVIAGDGCIVRRDGKLKALDVVGDKDVCEKVAAVLKSNAPIKHLKGGCYNVRFFSPRLAHSLAKLGFGPAKTYELKFPEIPENLLPHFVRGYWEADGCVTHKSDGAPRLSAVSASESFALALMEHVKAVTGSKASVVTQIEGRTNPCYIVATSCLKACSLGAWLWDNSTEGTRSDRKYARFNELRSFYGKG